MKSQSKLLFISLQKTTQRLLKTLFVWSVRLLEKLGGRVIAILAAALLFTMVSVVITDNWILTLDQESKLIGQLRENMNLLNQLKANLYRAESAQRGYLVTQRSDYVMPLNSALAAAKKNLKDIEALTLKIDKHVISQNTIIDALIVNIEVKAAEMRTTLGLARVGRIREAKQVVNLDEGKIETEKFIANVDQLMKYQTNALSEMLIKRNNSTIITRMFVVGGALILILLTVIVLKQLLLEITVKSDLQKLLVKENTRNEDKLQEQKVLLRSLALDYQADVERERQKLSRELHDELGSIFTATKMDIAWVIKKLKETEPTVADKLAKTARYIDQGINYQRHIVQELHPAMLSTFGFWPALNSLIDDAVERNQWQLTLTLPDENTKINETISLIAYRIVQETLNNANKYAQATQMSIHMLLDEKYLKVEIEDNGVGVDMKALDGNTHGLSGMRHRVMAIGGRFEILSELGRGVLTRALIPLDVAAV